MNAPRMTRDQAVARLLDGIQDDLGSCDAIRALLEPQLEAMEARRVQRVQLVRALLGADATMADLFAKLDAARREAAAGAWRQLEALVRDCKEATARNGSLMAEQYSTMQRLLHGEDATYAPR